MCNLNDHSNDCILDRVYANLHRDSLFELRDSNDGIFDLFCAQIYIVMCNLNVRTRSKIPSFEWSFKLRYSNNHSNCALLLWGAFHQAFCQCFSLTNFISYWNPCIWLAESKFVSENTDKMLDEKMPLWCENTLSLIEFVSEPTFLHASLLLSSYTHLHAMLSNCCSIGRQNFFSQEM